jgi:hypothetical protein
VPRLDQQNRAFLLLCGIAVEMGERGAGVKNGGNVGLLKSSSMWESSREVLEVLRRVAG